MTSLPFQNDLRAFARAIECVRDLALVRRNDFDSLRQLLVACGSTSRRARLETPGPALRLAGTNRTLGQNTQHTARNRKKRMLRMKYLHTMVRVSDIDESLDFYCNKLGLAEVGAPRKRGWPIYAGFSRRAGQRGRTGGADVELGSGGIVRRTQFRAPGLSGGRHLRDLSTPYGFRRHHQPATPRRTHGLRAFARWRFRGTVANAGRRWRPRIPGKTWATPALGDAVDAPDLPNRHRHCHRHRWMALYRTIWRRGSTPNRHPGGNGRTACGHGPGPTTCPGARPHRARHTAGTIPAYPRQNREQTHRPGACGINGHHRGSTHRTRFQSPNGRSTLPHLRR